MNKSFEDSFDRLEDILKQLNDGKISLDESLKVFEEADKLISDCNSKLNFAEQKVEKLIKNRNGELELNENNTPKKESFTSPSNTLTN